MKKICVKCKINKNITDFHNSKATKDGKRIECKSCIKQYQIIYRSKEGFKEKKKIKDKIYQEKNREILKEKRKLYELKNPNRQKDYNKKNLKKNNLVQKIKYYKNASYKLRKIITSRIILEIKGKVKFRTHKILGCSYENVRNHIEKQFKPEMTWENHGKIWEIDHIKPCASFNLIKLKEQQKCFHYTNLMPRFKTTEIAKSFGYLNEIGNRNKGKKIL